MNKEDLNIQLASAYMASYIDRWKKRGSNNTPKKTKRKKKTKKTHRK
jgi:hypothetical protein